MSGQRDTSGKRHTCPHEFCQKSFSRPSKLVHHIRTHTNERPFSCPAEGCDRAYTRQAHLKRHLQSSHTTDETSETICCTTDGCPQTFKTAQNLKKHLNRVHNHERLKCPEDGCDQTFHKKTQLKTHIITHEGRNPFKCDIDECGRIFFNSSELAKHKKIHEGYTCREEGCEEHFPLWTLLRKHMSTAHVKSAPCPECGKTFLSKTRLKRHRLTHQDTRDMYMCPESGCERGYFDQRNLNAHVRVYHQGNRFKCDHANCGRTFSTKQKQQQHMTLHDPNRPIPKKKSRKGKRRTTMAARLSGLSDKTGKRLEVTDLSGLDLVSVTAPGAGPAATHPRTALPGHPDEGTHPGQSREEADSEELYSESEEETDEEMEVDDESDPGSDTETISGLQTFVIDLDHSDVEESSSISSNISTVPTKKVSPEIDAGFIEDSGSGPSETESRIPEIPKDDKTVFLGSMDVTSSSTTSHFRTQSYMII